MRDSFIYLYLAFEVLQGKGHFTLGYGVMTIYHSEWFDRWHALKWSFEQKWKIGTKNWFEKLISGLCPKGGNHYFLNIRYIRNKITLE